MDFKDILGHLSVLPAEERRLLALLMLTGMRRGEVLGLRWEDIDLENRLIHMRRNVPLSPTSALRKKKERAISRWIRC